MLEVKSVERLLGTPVSYAYAVKAGPWIFMTGHEAYGWTSGISDEVAGAPGFPLYGLGRSRREADFILQRMRRLLGEFGSDLAHSVRLDQYYPNPQAVAAYHLSRHAEFHDYIPPSTSVVMERCFGGDTTISTSLIAVMPSRDTKSARCTRRASPRPRPRGLSRRWSATTSSSSPARWRTTRAPGSTRGRIVPEYSAWAGIQIRKQTEFLILAKLKPALEAAGSSLERS